MLKFNETLLQAAMNFNNFFFVTPLLFTEWVGMGNEQNCTKPIGVNDYFIAFAFLPTIVLCHTVAVRLNVDNIFDALQQLVGCDGDFRTH